MKKEKIKVGKTVSTKLLAVLLSAGLLVGGVIGGTVAWLTTRTTEVKNTFTTSDIDITLEETTKEYKMIPGWTIKKDPKATVVEGSEDCYLFVKAEKSANFDGFMTYEIAGGWTELDGVEGVYYRIFDSKDTTNTNAMGTGYSILKDDQVQVKGTVTKVAMEDLTENAKPTLTFTAYASQLYKNNNDKFTPGEAWGNLNSTSSGSEATE